MMKVIIGHKSTKREILGVFEICSDRETLLHIGDTIRNKVERDDFSYGWVTVYPKEYDEGDRTNKAPIGWED